MRVAAELIQLFEFQPTAYTRLRKALISKSPDGALLLQLSDLASNMGLNGAATEFRSICQTCNPQRFIHQANPTEATSIKLGNVRLAFDGLSATGIFILTTISKEVVHQTSGFLQAAGIIAILAMIYKSIAVKLDEREATVLWVFSGAKARRRIGGRRCYSGVHQCGASCHRLYPLDRLNCGMPCIAWKN